MKRNFHLVTGGILLGCILILSLGKSQKEVVHEMSFQTVGVEKKEQQVTKIYEPLDSPSSSPFVYPNCLFELERSSSAKERKKSDIVRENQPLEVGDLKLVSSTSNDYSLKETEVNHKKKTKVEPSLPQLVTQNLMLHQGTSFNWKQPILVAMDESNRPLSLERIQINGRVNSQVVGVYPVVYSYAYGNQQEFSSRSLIYVLPLSNELLNDRVAEKEMCYLLNQYRQRYHLSQLTETAQLNQAARLRSQELEKNYGHTRPNGSNFATIGEQIGLSLSAQGQLGENIQVIPYQSDMTTQQVVQKLFSGWVKSSAHNQNMLTSFYDKAGFGIYKGTYKGKPVIFGTQWFLQSAK